MKRLANLILLLMFCVSLAWAQGKGVDNSSERVRDNANRAPASNGSKTDTGAGRGMDFGRAPEVPPLPNPYRLTARRDVILNAVADVMKERKLIVDEAASRPEEGIIVSQPFTFIKGAVVSQAELGRYADVETRRDRGWTRGRFTISVEVQPIDGTSANVAVNAKIEGRTDGATGAEWTTLRSTGVAEEEFLIALITNVTGGPPPGHTVE
ncbi:MAG TPA: hypothetical protein VGW36_02025 [Pyrinomonadaceae bacterium]|nr:hypothetical protein [Pyrinomonadaceae bacterium]